MDPEKLKKIREILGAGDDFTEENMLSRIEERVKADADEKLTLSKDVATLKGEIETLKKSKGNDKDKKASIDPDVLDERAETATEKIDGLVEKAKITPKVAASLKDILVGKPNERNAFMLSRKVSGTDESITRQIVAALAENDPVELGEKTKAQTIAMSRMVPGDDDYKPDEKEVARTTQIALEVSGHKAQ